MDLWTLLFGDEPDPAATTSRPKASAPSAPSRGMGNVRAGSPKSKGMGSSRTAGGPMTGTRGSVPDPATGMPTTRLPVTTAPQGPSVPPRFSADLPTIMPGQAPGYIPQSLRAALAAGFGTGAGASIPPQSGLGMAPAAPGAPMRPRPRPEGSAAPQGSQAPQGAAQNASLLSRLSSGDTLARLAMILDGMSLRPNEALQTVVKDRIARGAQKETSSRTAAWLRSLGTAQATQAADALEAGAIDAQTAVAFATKKQDDGRTALMQNYEYALSQGMTPEQARQWVSSGTTVQVGGKAETAFETENAKNQAGFFGGAMQQGLDAKSQLGKIAVMESLLSSGIGGTADAWKAWAQDTLGINVGAGGGVEALNATINQLIPEQRAPGSGSSSDKDIAMFRASLPSLVNSPEGNRIIVATMRGLAEHKIAMGEIATAVAMGNIPREEGLARMAALPDPMANAIPLIQQLVPNVEPPPSTLTREEAARLLLSQP